jgi:hypothetical protein
MQDLMEIINKYGELVGGSVNNDTIVKAIYRNNSRSS